MYASRVFFFVACSSSLPFSSFSSSFFIFLSPQAALSSLVFSFLLFSSLLFSFLFFSCLLLSSISFFFLHISSLFFSFLLLSSPVFSCLLFCSLFRQGASNLAALPGRLVALRAFLFGRVTDAAPERAARANPFIIIGAARPRPPRKEPRRRAGSTPRRRPTT